MSIKLNTGSHLLVLAERIKKTENSINSFDILLDKKFGRPPTKVVLNLFNGALLLENIEVAITDDDITTSVDNIVKHQRLQLLKELEELKNEMKTLLE